MSIFRKILEIIALPIPDQLYNKKAGRKKTCLIYKKVESITVLYLFQRHSRFGLTNHKFIPDSKPKTLNHLWK